jgi:50S ribosomal protein L16 3-hydroxylase
LQDNLHAEGLYTDADLQLQKHPAEISDAMIKKVSEMLQKITWDKNNIADFLAQYLTEPKTDVVFEPNRKISKTVFSQQLTQKKLVLDLKSQLLFTQNNFYLNGEKIGVPSTLIAIIRELADTKVLNTSALEANIHGALSDALYDAYLAGFVNIQ